MCPCIGRLKILMVLKFFKLIYRFNEIPAKIQQDCSADIDKIHVIHLHGKTVAME